MARVKQYLANIHAASVRQNHDGFWTVEDIAAFTGYTRSTVYRKLIKQEGFPKPISFKGTNGKRWAVKQVRLWLETNTVGAKR